MNSDPLRTRMTPATTVRPPQDPSFRKATPEPTPPQSAKAIYIELHYIFNSVWGPRIYSLYGAAPEQESVGVSPRCLMSRRTTDGDIGMVSESEVQPNPELRPSPRY